MAAVMRGLLVLAVSDIVVLAAIAAASPVLLAWITARQRRAEKKEDYARQDEVDARNAAVVKEAKDLAEQVAAQQLEDASKLDALKTGQEELHDFANSAATAQMVAELHQTETSLSLMHEVAQLHKEAGKANGEAAIKAMQTKVNELREAIDVKRKQEAPTQQEGVS